MAVATTPKKTLGESERDGSEGQKYIFNFQ
jgi:hypothetical protein